MPTTTNNQSTVIQSLELSQVALQEKANAYLTLIKVETSESQPDCQLILQYNEEYRELQIAVTDIGQMISHYRSILGQL